MLDEAKSSSTSEEKSAAPITPEVSGDKGRDKETHDDDEGEVDAVLPADDGVLVEIAHVCDTGLAARLDEHPTEMGPPKTVMGAIGVKIGVGVAVVGTMTTAPPFNGTFDGTGTRHRQKVAEGTRSVVGTMRPETMVSRSNAQSSDKVVPDTPQEGLELPFRRENTVDREGGCHSEYDDRDPLELIENV
jgi:hypothetical protein